MSCPDVPRRARRRRCTLDVLVARSDAKSLANDARGDIAKLSARVARERDKGAKYRMRAELGALRKEVRPCPRPCRHHLVSL